VVLLTAFVLVPVTVMNASDIPDQLAKKGPAGTEVITRPTITRMEELPRLPVSVRQGEFLLDHPHLSMVLARISDPKLDLYRVEVMPNGLIHITDPAGLAGDAEIVESVPGRRAYFVTGYFDVLKIRLRGRMLIKISYKEHTDEPRVSADATTACYIKVDSSVVGVLAKVVNFIFPKKVDGRINRFVNAVRIVAAAVHDDPSGSYNKLASSGELSHAELSEFERFFLSTAGKE